MEVQIITPDSTLFNGEATLVVVPGIDGQMGFLTIMLLGFKSC